MRDRQYKKLVVEPDPKDPRIIWVRLNRPQRLNALDLELMQELGDALIEADRDPEIQAILVTGKGRAFCAGADLGELMSLSFQDGLRWFSTYYRIIDLLRSTGKPTIAAVNGDCVAGGNEIAMACDLVLASKSARFGQPEARVGATAMGLGLQLLPLIIGEKRARELLFTARLLSAQEAHQIGLVNRVVDEDQLEEESRRLAAQVLDNISPQAFRVIKSGLKFWTDLATLNLQLARDITCMVWSSQEFRQRSKEFLEKRKPTPGAFMGITPRP